MGVPDAAGGEPMTDERCRELILQLGAAQGVGLNSLRGVPGSFFHGTEEERLADLQSALEGELCRRAATT